MAKCKSCKKNFDSYQMSSNNECNICAYYRKKRLLIKSDVKKFKEAKIL